MFLSVEGTCRPTFLGIPPDDLLPMPRPMRADADTHTHIAQLRSPHQDVGDAGVGGGSLSAAADQSGAGARDGGIGEELANGLAAAHIVPPGNPFAEPPKPSEGEVSPAADRGNVGPAVGGVWGPAVLSDVPPEVLVLLKFLRPRLQQPGGYPAVK